MSDVSPKRAFRTMNFMELRFESISSISFLLFLLLVNMSSMPSAT